MGPQTTHEIFNPLMERSPISTAPSTSLSGLSVYGGKKSTKVESKNGSASVAFPARPNSPGVRESRRGNAPPDINPPRPREGISWQGKALRRNEKRGGGSKRLIRGDLGEKKKVNEQGEPSDREDPGKGIAISFGKVFWLVGGTLAMPRTPEGGSSTEKRKKIISGNKGKRSNQKKAKKTVLVKGNTPVWGGGPAQPYE